MAKLPATDNLPPLEPEPAWKESGSRDGDEVLELGEGCQALAPLTSMTLHSMVCKRPDAETQTVSPLQ